MLIGENVEALNDDWGGELPEIGFAGAEALALDTLSKRRQRAGSALLQDQTLLQSLTRLPIDGRVGSDLFQVVAKLIAHVFSLDAKRKGGLHD